MCCPLLGLALESRSYIPCVLQQLVQFVILLLFPQAKGATKSFLAILNFHFSSLQSGMDLLLVVGMSESLTSDSSAELFSIGI